MPLYSFICGAGHETERFYKMSDRRPSSVRCVSCRKPARRRFTVPQVIGDIPSHFNTSLNMQIEGRSHLRRVQREKGCQDWEGGVPDPPSDWR